VPRHVNRAVAPGLTLLGFDAPEGPVEAGASIPLTLVWQASGAARPNYEVGVAVLPAGGQPVTATWLPPGGNDFPTSSGLPSKRSSKFAT
jgi:hypothetical protein